MKLWNDLTTFGKIIFIGVPAAIIAAGIIVMII